MSLEFFTKDLNLLELVVNKTWVGSNWAKNRHHAVLSNQPSRQLIVSVVEVFDVFQEFRTSFASVHQVLPATRDCYQLVLKGVSTRHSTLTTKQVGNLNKKQEQN
jgi:hypothetical protein